MPRECGECQLCCVLIGVKELNKYPHQTCQHQCQSGCAIHNTKPHECRTYQCYWRSNESVAEELRPDKLGCIIDIHNTPLGTAIVVHQQRSNQWQDQNVAEILHQLAVNNHCWIYCIYGNDRQAIFPVWADQQRQMFDAMTKSGHMPEIYGSILHHDG